MNCWLAHGAPPIRKRTSWGGSRTLLAQACQAANDKARKRASEDGLCSGTTAYGPDRTTSALLQEWAERAGVVETVRLYGSRAKDSARSDSDANVARAVGTSPYVRLLKAWQKELEGAVKLQVMLKQYISPADDTVRRYCDEFSLVLFPRQAGATSVWSDSGQAAAPL